MRFFRSSVEPARAFRKSVLNKMKKVLLVLSVCILSLACGVGPDLSKDRVPRSPSPTPFVAEKPIADYMAEGSAAFLAGDYHGALPPYKRALEIEQRDPHLDKISWRELVNNSALSYGQTGDLKNARVVLAYGLSKDFSYPMFHYILACTYGEEGNEIEAIHHLRKAYENKKNLMKGETFPDPLTDSSFSNFSNSDTFKKAVAQMKRAG